MTPPPHEADTVESLRRGIDVLAVLSQAARPLTLAEVAKQVDSSRPTARRLLITLADIGYVGTDGPTFWLRPTVMELGDIYLGSIGLPDIAHPHLARLADRVGDTCSLTILDGTDVVYIDRVKPQRFITANLAVGTRMPAVRMSTGRVLLGDLDHDELKAHFDALPVPHAEQTSLSRAELEQLIRDAAETGYAIADQEFDPRFRSIAAPVHAPDGRTVAAVNVSTQVTRVSVEQLRQEVLPELLGTTRAIEAELTGS